MGQDLLVGVLSIDSGTEPDFDAMRETARRATLADVGNLAEIYLDDDELRETLLGRVDDLEAAWVGNCRDAIRTTIRDADVMIAGGSSWGDSPGPSADAVWDLAEVEGLIDAGGFDT